MQLLTSLEDIRLALEKRFDLLPADIWQPPDPMTLSLSTWKLDCSKLDDLRSTLSGNKKIVIYGDYDCDGMTASAMLWELLSRMEIQATVFLPDREQHGYGLSQAGWQALLEKEGRPEVLICVDNGISAKDFIDEISKNGTEVFVIDHHLAEQPTTAWTWWSDQLSAGGLVWLISREWLPQLARQQYDLVALSLLADQIPLNGHVRSIVARAWHELATSNRPGLQALLKQWKNARINSPRAVSYYLIPLLNAAGRLGDPLVAVRLLLTQDLGAAQRMASKLINWNVDRRNSVASEASRLLSQSYDDPIIVVQSKAPEGVLGLLAANLMESFEKPALVCSITPAGYKCSARAPKGWPLQEVLRSLPKEWVIAMGGHAAAMGCTLNKSIEWTNIVSHLVEKSTQSETLAVENEALLGQLEASLINSDLLDLLDEAQPYGTGNPEPEFLIKATFTPGKRVGQNARHLQGTLKIEDLSYHSIWFGAPEQIPQTQAWIVKVVPDNYRGGVSLQILANVKE